VRIGVFGGSFDPPQFGHVNAVKQVLAHTPVEEVWVMPCLENEFKQPGTGAFERLEMARLAFAGIKGVRVSDFEVSHGIKTTAESLEALRQGFPQHSFDWIVGSELVNQMPSWRGAKGFLENTAVWVVPRTKAPALEKPFEVVECDEVSDASSTLARKLLVEGRDARELVPTKVLDFIKRKRLYWVAEKRF